MEGQRIGNYRVMRKVGQGGMGSVWEAKHEQLGRKAAIKLLRRELTADPQVMVRFFNEAKTASRVDHPSIVKVEEFGSLPDGTAYIIMEFLTGEPLSVRLRNLGGKLSLPDIYRFSRQIASALSATHEKGIVHRDLKPDNVMLVGDLEVAGGERVKILDFGIAKVITEYSGPGAEEFKTSTGLVLGTATYMAPEQCKGAGDVTEKADVYSLGIVMYRMCSGKVPYRAEGPGEVMAMHIFSQPQPLREVEPRIPEPLAALVHRMMSKEPHERPTMAQVAQELERMVQAGSNPAVGAKSTGSSAAVGAKSTGPSVAVVGSGQGSSSAPTVDALPAGKSTGSQPSMVGTAVGQSGGVPAVTKGSRSRVGLWLSVLLGLGLVGASVPYGIKTLPKLLAPKPKLVYWNITSSPPVVQVFRKADGQAMGQTPWTHNVPQGTGRQLYVLRQEGYLDEELWFDEMASDSRMVTLRLDQKPKLNAVDGGAASTAPVIVLTDAGAATEPTSPQGGRTARDAAAGVGGSQPTQGGAVPQRVPPQNLRPVGKGTPSGTGTSKGVKPVKELPGLPENQPLSDDNIKLLNDE
ncbi:MAG TPA: protein kinase [Pseudomonadota bacterium]|nr:protein kinase [Pseudomonadota bacterium]